LQSTRNRLWALLVVLTGLSTNVAFASQGTEPVMRSPEYWFAYASKLPIGSPVRVQTTDGHRETAVLAVVDREGITLERTTRNPEPPVRIAYANLLQLEPQQHGSGVGKAIAIGAAVGAATFFGILLFFTTAMN
jgi:hypothetical protein